MLSTDPLPVVKGAGQDGQLVPQGRILDAFFQESVRVRVLLTVQFNLLPVNIMGKTLSRFQ
jgi:hypothetical protein